MRSARIVSAGLLFAPRWRKRKRVRARIRQLTGLTAYTRARVSHGVVLVALVAHTLLSPTHAQATPWLRVRAQVSIELHAQRTSQGMRLLGTLRDDLGAPLQDRELMGYFEAQQSRQVQSARMRGLRARTDEHGAFTLPVPCPNHQACRATIEFDGDAFHERSAATALVEPERAEVQLTFEEPQALALPLDDAQIQVRVSAQSTSPASGANLQLVLENELARRVASGVTDAAGHLSMQVDSHLFGEPGLGELILRSAADATRSAARIRKPIVRTRQSQLTLQAHYERTQQSLSVRIQLRTSEGPLASRAVGVFAGTTHVVTLVTDAEGSAERTLSITPVDSNDANGPLGLGRHALSARFDSDVPGLSSAHTGPVLVEVEPPPRPNSAWLIVPAAASIVFAVWSARRSQSKQAPRISIWQRGSEVKLGELATWAAANHHALTGVVEDADDGHPLPATISLSSGVGFTASLKVSAQGLFDSGALPTGRFRARVFAPGYEPAEFELSIPHSGAGTQMRIALRSLRVIALDTYDSVLIPLVGQERARAHTVRETLAAAVSGGLARENVGPLADSVEHMAYARAVPLESDLRDLQRRAATTLEAIARYMPESQNPGSGTSQTQKS